MREARRASAALPLASVHPPRDGETHAFRNAKTAWLACCIRICALPGNRQIPTISNRPEGHCPGRYLGVSAMTRLSLLKIFRKLFATPARYVSRYDRVDPKLLPLISQRYV